MRKAENHEQPIDFNVHNDTDYDVRIMWVNFDGHLDPRPERQSDVIKSNSCMSGGGDTGHSFAFLRMDTGQEVACVRFKSTERFQSSCWCLLSSAIQMSDGVDVPNGGRTVSVLPDIRTRYEADRWCGFSDEQNTSHPSNLLRRPDPTVSLEFEQVVVGAVGEGVGAG